MQRIPALTVRFVPHTSIRIGPPPTQFELMCLEVQAMQQLLEGSRLKQGKLTTGSTYALAHLCSALDMGGRHGGLAGLDGLISAPRAPHQVFPQRHIKKSGKEGCCKVVFVKSM